jgi:hypothetical protein
VNARDFIEILIGLLTVGGSVSGAFFGAKISIARLEERVRQSEEFILELRKMKHLRVDPYLGSADSNRPNTIDDLEARIRKLEKS